MISDAEYNRLYRQPPKTTKGRALRAALLIRRGVACTRAYDDCFEQGDGGNVLALLLENVRAHPELRRMMREQGAWSKDYEDQPEATPLVIGEAERIEGFRRATGGFSNAADRWRERAVSGMTDDDLADALAFELGTYGGSGGPDCLCLTFQAAGLKIWISWHVHNTQKEPPTFQGRTTIAMARTVYGIRDPSDRQLALF